ncbi:hypothetical protein [Engelhardtia mirabilis]|uniref:Uncharacterized protein n=1 Tax=Engelhardtia mirabilis TaxID=2528011 RepID=A0A518BIL1_9BACT|nr:hypothetical protein Pla133_18820 [Planctomycetes bacterium Pla133]QDV01132.1 hypothetical protein Pla86_18810 [Planctomycetes bacterium Pla86]
MTPRFDLGRTGLLLALALPLTSCDPVFGSRPIGGGEWNGSLAKIEAPAADVWTAVSEVLEELDAGKATPYPEGSATSVRVSWQGSWAKVAVDSARPYDSVVSAFTMGQDDHGDHSHGGEELLSELLAGLKSRGFAVDETWEGHGPHSAVPAGAFQTVGKAYRMPGWEEFHEELYGGHGGGHGGEHGDAGHGDAGHGSAPASGHGPSSH